MRRMKVARMLWCAVVALLLGNSAVSGRSLTDARRIVISDTVSIPVTDPPPFGSKSILKPDFAFPADVKATAEAFLKDYPVGRAGERVLAVTEIAVADYNIDNQSGASSLRFVLDLADKTADAATRAMLYAYGATICRSMLQPRGTYDRPDPSRIDQWSYEAKISAADSLLVLALHTVPADTPLKDYAAALTEYDAELSPFITVRDFITDRYLGSVYTPDKKLVAAVLASDTPYGVFYATGKETTDSIIEFFDSISDSRLLKYAIEAFLGSNYNDRKTLLPIYERIAKYDLPRKISEAVSNRIKYFKSPDWTLKWPDVVVADKPFEMILKSSNTNEISIRLYHLNDTIQYYGWSHPDSLDLVDAPYRTLRFVPKSGDDQTIISQQCTLPAGLWAALEEGSRYKKGCLFNVTPWQAVDFSFNQKGIAYVQVFDAETGKPCEGLSVKYTTAKNKHVVTKTNRDGIAKLKNADCDDVLIWRPGSKTFYEYEADCLYEPRRIDWDIIESEKEIYDITGTTDLPVYHQNDTVRWAAVARGYEKLVAGAKLKVKTMYPSLPRKNSEEFVLPDVVTDAFGRVEGEFVLPPDCPLGKGSIYINGDKACSYTVSDFRLPELSIVDNTYVLEGDSVMLKGKVVDRTNTPRPNVDIRVTIPLDNGSTIVMNTETETDGIYRLMLSRGVAGKNRSNTSYTVEAMTSDGYHAEKSGNFETKNNVILILKDYLTSVDVNKGLSFTFEAFPYGSGVLKGPIECVWTISERLRDDHNKEKTVLTGKAMPGTVVLPPDVTKSLKAGSYILSIKAVDGLSNEDSNIFDVYNPDKPEIPVDDVFWVIKSFVNADDEGNIEITIGTEYTDVVLWWIPVSADKPIDISKVNSIALKQGYQTLSLRPGAGVNELVLWSVYNGMKTSRRITIQPKEPAKLSISFERFTDTVVPGTKTRWTLVSRLDNIPVETAVILNVLDERMLTLGTLNSPYVGKEMRRYECAQFSYDSYGKDFVKLCDGNNYVAPYFLKKLIPDWLYIGMGRVLSSRVLIRGVGSITTDGANDEVFEKKAKMTYSAFGGTDFYEAANNGLFGARGMSLKKEPDLSAVDVRGLDRMTALWAPMLTTDAASGAVDVDFVLPPNSTTWAVRAWAWTKDLDYARISRTFTARSPIYVNPSTPRFVRVGDTVNIVTAIVNTTDTTQHVTCDVAVGDATPVVSKLDVAPRATGYVTTTVAVDGALALADTLHLTVRATNGMYGDGQRVGMPILPSSALVTESQTFYLNPGQSSISLEVPRADTDESAEVTLDYTVNPMWTVVKAMPEILDNAVDNEIWPLAITNAQAHYVACVARMTASLYPSAVRHVIDPDKASKAAANSLSNLLKLQTSEGGFRPGTWANEATFGNTLAVLSWFYGITDIVDGDTRKAIDRALAYVDSHAAGSDGKPGPDLRYALVRSTFGRPGTLAGQQVMDATVNYLVKNWRALSLNDKPLAAMVLAANGHKAVAAQIIESVTQHSVRTSDRGLVLPNLWGPVSYSNYLQAMYAVDKTNPTIDAVRQAMMCMRRGNDWGNVAQTAYVVRSMTTTGTDWNVLGADLAVKVDGKAVAVPERDVIRGAFTMPLAAGDEVSIGRTEAQTPAYGAVVTRRVVPLSDVDAYSIPELSITKAIYTTDAAGRRVDASGVALTPGQKVTVSLTLHAEAAQSDVVVVDQRPVAFEPVNQLPVYTRAAGSAYTWGYMLPRNATTELFIDRLPRGYTTFEYEAIVGQTGTFTTGIATVTNSVDPDLTAHSASAPLVIK